jgi:hypothetical protein
MAAVNQPQDTKDRYLFLNCTDVSGSLFKIANVLSCNETEIRWAGERLTRSNLYWDQEQTLDLLHKSLEK